MWVSRCTGRTRDWSRFDFERADELVGQMRKYKSIDGEIIVNDPRKKDPTQQEKFIDNETCPVYCLTVSSGVFYVRRNGKACWTGNSRNQDGPRETLTRQPVKLAGVRNKILASPTQRAKSPNSGKLLKLLIPSLYRNI